MKALIYSLIPQYECVKGLLSVNRVLDDGYTNRNLSWPLNPKILWPHRETVQA